jgi:hypothetical protein
MTKHVETQPGSPRWIKGEENCELWEDDLDRAYERIYELEDKLQDYDSVKAKYADIQHWYETADRSAHSWADLDKIMENTDEH